MQMRVRGKPRGIGLSPLMPHHETRVLLCPSALLIAVYHGKVGHGLSIEISVKHGPVTMLSVVESSGGKLKLQVAEGERVAWEVSWPNLGAAQKYPVHSDPTACSCARLGVRI